MTRSRLSEGVVLAMSLALPCWCAAQPAPPAAAQAASGAPASPFGNLPLQRDAERAGAASSSLFGIVAGGALLLVALAAAYHWRRTRLPSQGGGAALRSAAALRLTPGATLHVVHWGEEQVLLACTPSAVTVVSRRGLPLPGPSGDAP